MVRYVPVKWSICESKENEIPIKTALIRPNQCYNRFYDLIDPFQLNIIDMKVPQYYLYVDCNHSYIQI